MKKTSMAPFCIEQHRELVDQGLARLLDRSASFDGELLQSAMRYGVVGCGKRIRPLLTLFVAESLECDVSFALPAACAIELVHCASLMLDDLPCMDNAALRRFKPCTHIVYGQDVTTLAAINLINTAYGALLDYSASCIAPVTVTRLIRGLQRTIGGAGLIGGQLRDLRPDVARPVLGQVSALYEQKTVSLFSFAAEAGALLGGADGDRLRALTSYARHLGLAFQISDDCADLNENSCNSGKDVSKDRNKTTFLKIVGPSGSERTVEDLIGFALRQIHPLGPRFEVLRVLALMLIFPPKAADSDKVFEKSSAVQA